MWATEVVIPAQRPASTEGALLQPPGRNLGDKRTRFVFSGRGIMELGSINPAPSATIESAIPDLTDEQYQELVQFASKMKGPSKTLSGMHLINGINWILDIGALRHVTGYCGFLDKRRRLTNPFSIILPQQKGGLG